MFADRIWALEGWDRLAVVAVRLYVQFLFWFVISLLLFSYVRLSATEGRAGMSSAKHLGDTTVPEKRKCRPLGTPDDYPTRSSVTCMYERPARGISDDTLLTNSRWKNRNSHVSATTVNFQVIITSAQVGLVM